MYKVPTAYLPMREHDPEGFRGDYLYENVRAVLENLVKIVYARSDLILATPFVADSLVHKLERSLAVIWVDEAWIWVEEAWRMTEPDASIPLAGFPRALMRLQSDDAKQLQPFCATLLLHSLTIRSDTLSSAVVLI